MKIKKPPLAVFFKINIKLRSPTVCGLFSFTQPTAEEEVIFQVKSIFVEFFPKFVE
jgi:hypothetical protein